MCHFYTIKKGGGGELFLTEKLSFLEYHIQSYPQWGLCMTALLLGEFVSLLDAVGAPCEVAKRERRRSTCADSHLGHKMGSSWTLRTSFSNCAPHSKHPYS